MSDNQNVSQIPARKYNDPLMALGFYVLGGACVVSPFFMEYHDKCPWWGYIVAFLLGGFILKTAKNFRVGVVVDPGADRISYGGKSVAISAVESCEVDVNVSSTKNGVSRSYEILLTGSFGTFRLHAKNEDQARAMEVFITKVRRMM